VKTPRKLTILLYDASWVPGNYSARRKRSGFAWKDWLLRESFLKKIGIAEKDPLRRVCEQMRARGCTPRRAKGWKAFAWPWRRQTDAC
jgi:hypothetical protein